MSGSSIQLARLFGIRIGASPSWFVFLFVIVYLLSGYFQDALDGSSTEAFVVALCAAFLFALSITLHELGHAWVARRSGITILGVELWFFGGLTKLDRDAETPGEEFRVAAAGLVATALIVLVATGVAIAISSPDEVYDSARFTDASVSPAVALLAWLATINLFLLVFNLVPAYPLDGGRIARSIAWRLTGERHRGTRIAGRLGQGFSYGLIGLGIYLAFTSDPFNGAWFVVLGFMMGQGARDAVVGADFAESIEGVTAADVMSPAPLTVAGDVPLAEAQAELERQDWPWQAVVDSGGRFLGILDASTEGTGSTGAAVPAADRRQFAVRGATPLESLLTSGPLRRLGALVVVDDGDRLIGVITVEQVNRALAAAAPGR